MTEKAIIGGGCFWGVQAYFDEVPGVLKTTVGYAGGHTDNPSYEDVCTHTTGHAEVAAIEFDPNVISYRDILRHFFRMHDPTQLNRQGPDVGDNYRSVIFYFTDEQKKIAEEVKEMAQAQFNKPIVTQIAKAPTYYLAEEYHQKFFQKTGIGACHIPYAPLKSDK
jgi:peptide-methionine (S)-S-oxide reductase